MVGMIEARGDPPERRSRQRDKDERAYIRGQTVMSPVDERVQVVRVCPDFIDANNGYCSRANCRARMCPTEGVGRPSEIRSDHGLEYIACWKCGRRHYAVGGEFAL